VNWQTPERPPRRRDAEPLKVKGPKIVVQYRAKGGKVYELQVADDKLAVHISRERNDADSGVWHVDAQSPCFGGPLPVAGSGATAAEAFGDAARAWKSHDPPLTVFDWDAIERELRVVQAL
jgi:hypothetical protein